MDARVATTMTFSIEVISLPVSDVDRAISFYVDRVGFMLDVDYAPNDAFRLVQLTPPGSRCSVQFGVGLGDALTGAFRTNTLIVSDLEAARNRLLQSGVEVGAIRHKTPTDDWAGCFAAGLDPARRDDASFADFFDPDGNRWVLQEWGYRGHLQDRVPSDLGFDRPPGAATDVERSKDARLPRLLRGNSLAAQRTGQFLWPIAHSARRRISPSSETSPGPRVIT
jgi:catechol 2,3-dioxygenase-like lactoylglutathione lyase family enzyme